MNFESWCAAYRPVANSNGLAFGFDDTYFMFETYGTDLAEVERVRRTDEAMIWTIIETETGNVLIEGYHLVNRVGYLIARVRHTGEPIEILLDEPSTV